MSYPFPFDPPNIILDDIPGAITLAWTSEDVFPVPPTVNFRMVDGSSRTFRVIEKASRGYHQYGVVVDSYGNMAPVEFDDGGQADIVREDAAQQMVGRACRGATSIRQRTGDFVRPDPSALLGSDDYGRFYRFILAFRTKIAGTRYYLCCAYSDYEKKVVYRCIEDAVGVSRLEHVSDPKILQSVVHEYFTRVSGQQEADEGTFGKFASDDDDSDLFS